MKRRDLVRHHEKHGCIVEREGARHPRSVARSALKPREGTHREFDVLACYCACGERRQCTCAMGDTFEFWLAKSVRALVYRMLVLNTGQVPWTLSRQLGVVFEPLHQMSWETSSGLTCWQRYLVKKLAKSAGTSERCSLKRSRFLSKNGLP